MKSFAKVFLIIFSLFQLTAAHLTAGPARGADIIFTQPDGTAFPALIKGDEWTKIRTTSEGNAITRDEEGWWCYAVYSQDGSIVSTGYKVGCPAPEDILSSSRIIPYDILRRNAQKFRKHSSTRKAPMTKGNLSSGKRSAIIILAQFQDVKFKKTKADFENLLNQRGYNGTGSAKDYYEDQFGEGWEFNFEVSDIVTLPEKLKHYGENDSKGYDLRVAKMAWEACKAADPYVNFASFDEDKDGEVENVYIFYAGYDEAELHDDPDLIWAHQFYIFNDIEPVDGVTKLDGVWVNRYACSSELTDRGLLCGIGTFCHEYGHTLGLPDFYDTNYDEDGRQIAAGLWKKTSLMDGGNYNNNSATPPNLNCIERYILGLTEPEKLQKGQTYTLEPVHKNGDCYILETDIKGEYFLFEYRSNEGWDKYIGGYGMLVYHIDEDEQEEGVSKWEQNTINADPGHQCADLIEADGRSDHLNSDYTYNNIRGIFFPQSSVTSITPEKTKGYKLWNGQKPSLSIAGITLHNNTISFYTTEDGNSVTVPVLEALEYKAFPDAIWISFKSKSPVTGEKAIVEWTDASGLQNGEIEIMGNDDGKYACLIKGLNSGNVIYKITAKIYSGNVYSNPTTVSILTKKTPSITWPYLFVQNTDKVTPSTGIVAHVVNSIGAVQTDWSLNGKPLNIGPDYMIYPGESGKLVCEITWDDGSTDMIVKEITITEKK